METTERFLFSSIIQLPNPNPNRILLRRDGLVDCLIFVSSLFATASSGCDPVDDPSPGVDLIKIFGVALLLYAEIRPIREAKKVT